jgi:predicted RNA-binding protein YlqC (UPF0109 family)
MKEDKQILEDLVVELVEFPDQVRIERTTDDMGVLLSVGINPADMGRIIGKEGQTARALRTILRALGHKRGSHISMKVLEPEGSSRERSDYAGDIRDKDII